MPILPEFEPTSEPTLSPSQITTFLLCPLRFRFTYIDKVERPWKSAALAFGSAVHSALEAWQMSRLSGEEIPVGEVEKTFLADWEAEKSGGVRFADDEEIDSLAERGKALVKLAVEALAPDRPQAVELPFIVDLGPWDIDVPSLSLRGKFDLLLEGDRLVEIKTASRRFDPETLSRNLQLSAYALAYRMLMGKAPALSVLTLLKTKVPKVEFVTTHRSHDDLDWFTATAKRVFSAIRHQSFFPNPSWACSDCEFAENCRTWRG